MSAPPPPLSHAAKITGGFAIAVLALVVLGAILLAVTAGRWRSWVRAGLEG
jgi:hypothetical protein